jgi:hypothetical protein
LRGIVAVIVEPVLTEEKLRLLLDDQHEQSCLDYKRMLDLSETRHVVELAKDVAAMQSEESGGYIDGNNVVLIYVGASQQGWCIFACDGEYAEEAYKDGANIKRKVTVFRVGDVFVRHGTASERWQDSDQRRLIQRVVSRRKEAWRVEFRNELAALGESRETSLLLRLTPGPCLTVSGLRGGFPSPDSTSCW